ncbi:TrbI/VirB10 family protein [Nostoc sp. FACHB-190]|uniref:TrbI/VirB10 family protein n=1 Tax=Nostoc sp. FACHB-190 TaxID=2692838 RepID=UPI0016834F3C|nr:TrbI/VirB10 family protein [Nostoc sp. FACHB-190]MBD2303273.1 hypothetical protein [Nostoc sp. FACHB-190]
MTDSSSSIDNLLKVEDDCKLPEFSDEQEKEIPKITKHNLSTSPWSRLLIVAVPFGSAFFIIFLFLNSIFNPSTKEAIKPAKQLQDTSAVEEKVDDGDVYAKLALSKQEDELNKLNSNQSKQVPLPEVETQKTTSIVSNPAPVTPRTVQSPTRYQPPASKVSRVNSPPALPRSFVNSSPRVNNLVTTPATKAIDPTAEFNRLRTIGSYGLIAYADSSVGESTITDPGEYPASFTQTTPPLTEPADMLSVPEPTNENISSDIEQIRPRWQADTQLKSDKYLPQEEQILQGQQTQYLTVGEFATGILITPLVKQQTDNTNSRQKTEDSQRFVAKLTQDLHDNYGKVAIGRDTLLVVELASVDAGNYATAYVRSIIKDNTEYPLTAGAISIHAQGGKPLIAKKFQDKGGEIAQYDLTVGLVGGLAKVGEIINQPDVQQSIQTGFGGAFSNTNIQNNRRNIGGAFLRGAFEKLGDIVSSRAESSTQEILARPNVWYIPQGTKVTFIVNRTLELP